MLPITVYLVRIFERIELEQKIAKLHKRIKRRDKKIKNLQSSYDSVVNSEDELVKSKEAIGLLNEVAIEFIISSADGDGEKQNRIMAELNRRVEMKELANGHIEAIKSGKNH